MASLRPGFPTNLQFGWIVIHYSRWENGGQPQPMVVALPPKSHYSRWENGGQPQLSLGGSVGMPGIIADGRTGANRNYFRQRDYGLGIIADGRTGANRNHNSTKSIARIIIADGRTGANRNTVDVAHSSHCIIADGRTGANRNRTRRPPRSCQDYSRWENGGQPQPGPRGLRLA